MSTLHYVITRDGRHALALPGRSLEPGRTQPRHLREQLLASTGIDAWLLHDDGLQLGLERSHYRVQMETRDELPDATLRFRAVPQARAWQRPGWFEETRTWLERTLTERLVRAEQHSSYDLASVLRMTTATRTFYLKVSETNLEARVSAHLARAHPRLVPEVVGIDARRNLLVTQDGGARLSESDDLELWTEALRKLAHFHQSESASLRALGCPSHDFTLLAARAESFLRDAESLRGWALSDSHIEALHRLAPEVRAAHGRVSTLGLPLCPNHGDAHPMNALVDRGAVWFDWREAGLAHPFLDVGWCLAWLSHPARADLPVRRAHPDAASHLWRSYLEEFGALSALPLLSDTLRLALMHRALLYHARFYSWRGTVSGWRPEYVPYHLRTLLKLFL